MNLLAAHALLFAEGDRSLLTDVDPNWWSALATAGVVMAGHLDEAETLDDLHDGLRHFNLLVDGGIIPAEDWAAEAAKVAREAYAMGEAEMQRRLESN